MTLSQTKILGVGSPILDVLVNVDDAFLRERVPGEKGGMELVDIATIDAILDQTSAKRSRAAGGSSGNTIAAMAKLGVASGFLGKLGDDEQGAFYQRRFAEAGADVSRFKRDVNGRTGLCLSLVTPDSERTMRTYLGAAAAIVPEDISLEDFAGYTHAHIEGYMLFNEPVASKILRLAKEAGLVVSMDLASFEVVRAHRQSIPDMAKEYIDILFANEVEAAELCDGDRDPERFLTLTQEWCDIVALKLGKDGAIVSNRGVRSKIDALVVDAVDTTGAGDLWQAGFLYGVLIDASLAQSGAYGAKLGAEVVQVMGAEIPEDRWDAIKAELTVE